MPEYMRNYNPLALADWQLASATAVVIVVRDPDANNEYQCWARDFGGPFVWAIDIDCGRADLRDEDEFEEWASSHDVTAARLERLGWTEAAEHVRQVIDQYNPTRSHD